MKRNRFEIGDLVRIVEEPVFIGSHHGGMKRMDLKHLVGLECRVTGYLPNMCSKGVDDSKAHGSGFYFLDVPKTKKGVPIGLLSEGFDPYCLEKIKGGNIFTKLKSLLKN